MVFFFNIFKMSIHCVLFYIVYNEETAEGCNSSSASSLCNVFSLSLETFKSSSVFGFQQFENNVSRFFFLYLFWNPWTCCLIYFIICGKNFSYYFFCPILCSPCEILTTHILEAVCYCFRYLGYTVLFFLLFSLKWGVVTTQSIMSPSSHNAMGLQLNV